MNPRIMQTLKELFAWFMGIYLIVWHSVASKHGPTYEVVVSSAILGFLVIPGIQMLIAKRGKK
jgi:hypothetical protein